MVRSQTPGFGRELARWRYPRAPCSRDRRLKRRGPATQATYTATVHSASLTTARRLGMSRASLTSLHATNRQSPTVNMNLPGRCPGAPLSGGQKVSRRRPRSRRRHTCQGVLTPLPRWRPAVYARSVSLETLPVSSRSCRAETPVNRACAGPRCTGADRRTEIRPAPTSRRRLWPCTCPGGVRALHPTWRSRGLRGSG